MDSKLEKLKSDISEFVSVRDWRKFHNPKDLAISISIESSELLEHFQWSDADSVNENVKANIEDIKDEMADIYIYLLEMSDVLGVDLIDAANKKIEKNAKKYPVEKAKGNSKKYTEL